MLLEVRNLTRRFGKLTAINDVSFSVEAGSIHGLIGPNGSGKTTMFNLISGFLKPNAGAVVFSGTPITGLRAGAIAAHGLVRTFQLTSIYRDMTVAECLNTGQHLVRRGSRRDSQSIMENGLTLAQEREAILEFMGLTDVRHIRPSQLPGGTQRTVSIATALAARPSLLLLDEPLAGLNPTEKASVIQRVSEMRKRGLTILLVEHDMKSVMSVCDRLCVINFGNKIGEGTPVEIRENPAVIEAYLGHSEAVDA